MGEGSRVIIQGFDVLDTVKHIHRLSKRHQAALLSRLEETIHDEIVYKKVRKAVLDSYNDYARGVIGSIFGDIDA